MTQPPPLDTTQAITEPPLDKPRILLVDDSLFSLSQVRKALGSDYAIDEAQGGAEGLKRMEQASYDVVITDLLMPHISGLAFLGHVKSRFPKTKVIISSADIQDSTAAKARSLGALAFVSKPVDPGEIRRVIRLAMVVNEPQQGVSFSPRYADAFKEIFNIGMGRAANALSKLVYEKVKLSVPRLDVIPRGQLRSTIAENFQDELAVVRQDFKGSAKGIAFLLMSKESGLRLVNALVSSEEAVPSALEPMDQELLSEIGNILINALVGSMANTLGISFDLEQPNCDVGDVKGVCNEFDKAIGDHILLVETLFLLPGRHIGGTLFIMMTSSEMENVLREIDRVF